MAQGNDDAFARRIVEMRKSRGLSQKELGELVGVSNKAVSKWETGEALPQMKTIIRLASIFETTTEVLLSGSKMEVGNTPKQNSAEDIELRKENKQLRTNLTGVQKKTKKAYLLCGIICFVSLLTAIVFFLNTSAIGNQYNKDIEGAGAEGTAVVFESITFRPANPIEQRTYLEYCGEPADKKFAKYQTATGEKMRALIFCNTNPDYIVLPCGSKKYVYVNNTCTPLKIDSDNANCYLIDYSLMNSYKKAVKDAYDLGWLDEMYEEGLYLNDIVRFSVKEEKAFYTFYSDKGEPVDPTITERYLDSKAKTIKVVFINSSPYDDELYDYDNYDDDYYVSFSYECILGELFSDDKGDVYFYDYESASAYSTGKELNGLVR